MFFDGWYPPFKTLISGVVAYVLLILLLRICGKRTLSKWNAFDYVVTIALGSTLATILLSKETTIVQGVTALVILVLLQFVVTWLSVRSKGFSRLVKARPTLLLWHGEFQSDALRRTRVTDEEVRAALRNQGFAYLSQAKAVILETDGSFSVIGETAESGRSTLSDVEGFNENGSP
ncbi:MAG: YetF domain-containing protein [Chthoniobacterales bacterium]